MASTLNGRGPVAGATTPIVKSEFRRTSAFRPEVMFTELGVPVGSLRLYAARWFSGVLTWTSSVGTTAEIDRIGVAVGGSSPAPVVVDQGHVAELAGTSSAVNPWKKSFWLASG